LRYLSDNPNASAKYFRWFKNPTDSERNRMESLVNSSLDNIWCLIAQVKLLLIQNKFNKKKKKTTNRKYLD